MSKGLTLSPKHGLNPCLLQCNICGDDTGEIALLGKLKEDAEAPRRACISLEPCKKCKEYMQLGVILISVKDTDKEYRTGGWCVVKDELIQKMEMPPELETAVLEKRVCMIPDVAWDRFGLPRGDAQT